MKTIVKTIVLEVRCEDESCGMVSAYRFWPDSSYEKILDACWHSKRMPTRDKILAQMTQQTDSATKKETP